MLWVLTYLYCGRYFDEEEQEDIEELQGLLTKEPKNYKAVSSGDRN
jgi:hypothetical protein